MSEKLTRQLHDYFAYLDEAQGAVDLVTIGEPRIGDGPLQPVQHEPLLRPPVRRGLLVAVAVAILVLVAGVVPLLLISGGDDSADDPVTTSSAQQPTSTTQVTETTLTESPPVKQPRWPGLTEDIPEGVESGMLTTSLGAARWVHLSSDGFTLPSLGPLEVNADGEFIVSDLPTGFWYSDGGIEWRREDSRLFRPGVPDDANQMTRYFVDRSRGEGVVVPWVPYADGSYSLYWIISSDPIEIWSSEGAFWVEEDLSGFVPPDSDGFTWQTDISRPITRYGNPEGNPDGVQSILHVRFSGPYLGVAQCHEADERLLVLEEKDGAKSVTSLQVPWEVLCNEPHLVTLFGTSDSVYAYVGDWSTGQVSVWRTGDGYTWTGLGSLHDQVGAPSSSELRLTVLPALQEPASEKPVRNQVVVVRAIDENQLYSWESTNGISWTPAPVGLPDGSYLTRLESGWFGTDGSAWWMHVGDSWVSLAELGINRNGDQCGDSLRGSGRTTLIFTFSCDPDTSDDPPTDLWIISLDS